MENDQETKIVHVSIPPSHSRGMKILFEKTGYKHPQPHASHMHTKNENHISDSSLKTAKIPSRN